MSSLWSWPVSVPFRKTSRSIIVPPHGEISAQRSQHLHDFAKLCGGLAAFKFTYETDADPSGKSEFRLREIGVFARIFDGTAELFRRAENILCIHTSLRTSTIFPFGKKRKREG